MKVIIHANGIEWQQRYAKHAVAGLRRHGIKAVVSSHPRPLPCDVAIVMGPNSWKAIERSNTPYLMFNRKFVGTADNIVHENCAISWDGFNGLGTFCVDEIDPTRLSRYINPQTDIEEWKTHGEHILICRQSNIGRSTKFKSVQEFYNTVEQDSNNQIRYKNKPAGEDNIRPEDVRAAFDKSKAVVVLNSTISVEALMAGYPVVSYDIGDPVYSITGHDIYDIRYPERRPLFDYLAHCQWTEEEIANGDFWNQLYPKRGPKLYEWKNDS